MVRGGKRHCMSFARGVPDGPLETETTEPDATGGTTVTFKPDPEVSCFSRMLWVEETWRVFQRVWDEGVLDPRLLDGTGADANLPGVIGVFEWWAVENRSWMRFPRFSLFFFPVFVPIFLWSVLPFFLRIQVIFRPLSCVHCAVTDFQSDDRFRVRAIIGKA